jgi:hypothetical protein
MSIQVKKTTYVDEGCTEPCWEVSNGYTVVRISKLYRIIGRPSIQITEFLGGEWNGCEEFDADFDELDSFFAERMAKQYSVYL